MQKIDSPPGIDILLPFPQEHVLARCIILDVSEQSHMHDEG